jgi:hypothetical protein
MCMMQSDIERVLNDHMIHLYTVPEPRTNAVTHAIGPDLFKIESCRITTQMIDLFLPISYRG